MLGGAGVSRGLWAVQRDPGSPRPTEGEGPGVLLCSPHLREAGAALVLSLQAGGVHLGPDGPSRPGVPAARPPRRFSWASCVPGGPQVRSLWSSLASHPRPAGSVSLRP